MSKYQPLCDHFRSLAARSWHATFEDIERIVGFRLPSSARAHSAWWANSRDQMPQKAAWLDAGWRTRDLNLGAGHVLFVRESGGTSHQLAGERARGGSAPPPKTNDIHDWETANSIAFQVGLAWVPIGRVVRDSGGRLAFPAVAAVPAIYRFRIRQDGSEKRYIGQTENLNRRFGFYRTPVPSQQTNVRLNAEFLRALAAGGEISIATITDGAWIDRGAGQVPADMASMATRCLLENAAILADGAAGIESLNRSEAAAAGPI